ncbi:unnamed protein product [Brachionus calyciflorus]|uniref:Uncharacterized protein n=1 Tax=Brachionus calyciflorus TaxID=104777 RepID=A0A813MG49_9BILA|nr:unnamed protein product [Brachionus calyciflorus]
MFYKYFSDFGRHLRQFSTDMKSIKNIDDEIKQKISDDAFIIYMNTLLIAQKTYNTKIIPHDPSDDLSNQNLDNNAIFEKFIGILIEYENLLYKNENLEDTDRKRLLDQSAILVYKLMGMAECIKKTEPKNDQLQLIELKKSQIKAFME